MQRQVVLNPQWPDAKWSVTGMFTHARFLVRFIEEIRYRLSITPLSSVHGCPLSFKWNGGRVNKGFTITKQEIDSFFKLYKKMKIPCFLTFSNRFITKKDLEDPDCNYILDKLAEQNNTENGVIITSDILSDYIRVKYPHLKQMASIIKITCEKEVGNIDYYRKLEDNFDKYVVAVDDYFNFELLEKLDKDKAEILVNSPCVMGCPHKAEHYDKMASLHEHHSLLDMVDLEDFQKSHCKAYPIRKQIGHGRNYMLTYSELKKIYDLGFRHFKLQGRYTASQSSILYDMATYIFEPDYMSALIFHAFG